MKNIAILASGSGTNAENIIKFFNGSSVAQVVLVMTNNPAAGVIERAERLGVACKAFTREEFRDAQGVEKTLTESSIDYIVLAGFLWLVPASIIKRWDGRIVNIHPALLPAYGGKGMYGERVHQAVVANGEHTSGITIHKVNEVYDSGDIIAQFSVELTSGETADTLAQKIHALEYAHFPQTILNDIQTTFRL